MLDALIRYAYTHGLEVEPGFAPKEARWTVSFKPDGTYTGIVSLAPDKKPRAFPKAPEFTFSQMKYFKGKGAHFLVTECQALVLLADGDETPDEKIAAKHRFCVAMLAEAGEGAGMPELSAVARTLGDEATLERIRAELKEKKARATDRATLLIGDDFPVEGDAWHEWWRAYQTRLNAAMDAAKGRAPKEGEAAGTMVCLASGDVVVPARLHPKITGLADVGANPAGAPLAGYDKEAFCSYGLTQSANGAVSEAHASAYRAALNALLKSERTSKRLAGMKIAFWFSEAIPAEDDPLAFLFNDAPEADEASALDRAQALVAKLTKPDGDPAGLRDFRYYALTLSGAAGRVMVRDWMHGSFEELATAVARWYEDLAIVNLRGTGLAKAPGLEKVITCPLPAKPTAQNYDDWIKPVGSLRSALWNAALRPDLPIPHAAVGLIMAQHRAFMQSARLEEAERSKSNAGLYVSQLQTRMALLRAYHNRREGGTPLEPALTKDHPSPAYQCGRLMAVLAQLQEKALGDVGAGVVQRFYGAASATPALVLGRLIRGSKFHLNKLDSDKLAAWYEQKIAEILGHVGPRFPKTLSLEEQSLFALGYYHQYAADRTKKSNDEGRETAEEKNDA